MKDGSGIKRSIINILKHLKTIPLDQVHENIDACIEVFEKELQTSGGTRTRESQSVESTTKRDENGE